MAKKIMKRPKTMREIQAAKEKVKQDGKITITNCSKQVVPIHLNPPKGVDFFVGAQDVRLKPNQTHGFNKSRIRMAQIDRLKKQGMIEIVYDSEKHER